MGALLANANAHRTTGFKKIETKIKRSESQQKLIEQSLPYNTLLINDLNQFKMLQKFNPKNENIHIWVGDRLYI